MNDVFKKTSNWPFIGRIGQALLIAVILVSLSAAALHAYWLGGSDFAHMLPNAGPTPTATQTPPLMCGFSSDTVYPIALTGEALASVGTNLYSFGGQSSGSVIGTSYKYDGSSWTPIAPLPQSRAFAAAVSDGTNIFILGGSLGAVGETTVYRYNIATNDYTTLAPFSVAAWNHAAVFYNGKIYKFAGTGPEFESTNAHEVYDIASNTWAPRANYPMATSWIGAFVRGNFIYGAGGVTTTGSAPQLKTYRYDPVTNMWDDAAIADLPATRWGAASAAYNGSGVLIGGHVNGTSITNISFSGIIWDYSSNSWVGLPSMPSPRARMRAAVLGQFLHIVGGLSNTGSESNSNYRLFCNPVPTSTPTPTLTLTATPTGTPGCISTFSYTGPAVAIPDNSAVGVNFTIPVSGLGTIADVNFRVDGTQSADPGSTLPGVNHSWVGDLVIKITSPGGTTVTVFDQPGVPASPFGCGSNNLAQLVLDDDGGLPAVESQCGANSDAAFPTGPFSPNNLLSAFDGQNANGNWTINISDVLSSETGSARAFSLVFSGPCSTPTATATATPTNTPTATATGTPCGPGTLDASFNGTGIVTTLMGTGDDGGRSVAIMPDGRIVAAGYGNNGSNQDFAIARYNPNGSLDTSFNGNGRVLAPIGNSDDAATAMVIQPDGKIVAAGYSYNGANNDFAVARFNSDGQLDITFNGTGIVITPVRFGDDLAFSIALQPDGKFVVAGQSYNGFDHDFAIVRYNGNGTLDTSFNNTGKVITAFGSAADVANAVAIQSDGKIVAAGFSLIGTSNNFALARYNPDGSLDTTFNGTGKVTTPVGTVNDTAASVAIQADGKIVAAGQSRSAANFDMALVRYNADGTLDTAFNGTGKVVTPIGAGHDIIYSIALQSDSKIVAAGVSLDGSNFADFALVRYNTNGSPDSSFNGTGKVITAIGSGDDSAHSVAIQADNKIIVAGQSRTASNNDFALVRYNTAPCPPNSINGTVTYGNAGGSPTPRFVSNVTITAEGSPNIFTSTDFPGGTYSLTGFGSGAYTVTPSKTGGVNGAISSFDAGRIALHVAGPPNPQLNATQLIVADVSGNGAVTSFDAGMIAKFVAGPPYTPPGVGVTATWRFTPVSRNYASVTNIIGGQDYTALLMGEISGNWMNTGARPEEIVGQQSSASSVEAEMRGRLFNRLGQGIPNARVILTDSSGKTRTVISNGFGYYHFDGLQLGLSYTISVESRGWTFQPMTINVSSQLVNLDMITEP